MANTLDELTAINDFIDKEVDFLQSRIAELEERKKSNLNQIEATLFSMGAEHDGQCELCLGECNG